MYYGELENREWCADEAFRIFCFKDTINFAALLFFLSGINRKCIRVKFFELNSN